MRLWAIGDLHLPGGDDKPMDVFGGHWTGHWDKIRADWREKVGEEDAVLIPGDISWAMQPDQARHDLSEIGELPGRKLIIRGNHDYWWNSLTWVKQVSPPSVMPLQHSALDLGDCVVCGTRGWLFPAPDQTLTEEDAKICSREVLRLEMALKAGEKLAKGRPLVVMLHFPPLTADWRDTVYTELLRRYPVHTVVYGHLHGQGIGVGFSGVDQGIRYELVSCDSLSFRLKEIQLQL